MIARATTHQELVEPSSAQDVALLALEVVAPPSATHGMYVDPDTGQLMSAVSGLPVID